MSNIVDRLFDDIFSQLPKDLSSNTPLWPRFPVDHLDKYEDYYGDEDDGIYTLNDYENKISKVIGRLSDDRGIYEPSTEDVEIIEGGIRVKGFEAIAFYKSRRLIDENPCRGKWGIFYIKQGLDKVAWDIHRIYPGYGDPQKLARRFLFEHEHYHFQSDIQVLMFESIIKAHLYLPLRRALRNVKTHFVEEALANKRAYDWAKSHNVGLEEFAYNFMSLQPNAYARFNEPLEDLVGEWLSSALDLNPPYSPPRTDLVHWVGTTPKKLMRDSLCPQYVIFPTRIQNWIDPAWIPPPVNCITESAKVIKKLQDPKESLLAQKWQLTKPKLIHDRFSNGLGFKQWPKEGPNVYSVRIDSGFRAHLENMGAGNWMVTKIGNHKEMGHG